MSEQQAIKFGYITYEETVPLTSEFAQNLLEGKIVGKVCNNCKAKYLPPRNGCSKCFSRDLSPFEVSPEATLKAFTVIHFPPESFADKAPYIVAIGEFEDGTAVLAHLTGMTAMPQVGMKIKLVGQKIAQDRVVYKFVKV